MGLTDDQRGMIPHLAVGQAFVSHGGLDRPMLVRMPELDAPPARADDNGIAHRFGQVGGEDHDRAVSLRPFLECEIGTSPCRYRSRARSLPGLDARRRFKQIMRAYPRDDNRSYKGERPATSAMRTTWRRGLVTFVRQLGPISPDATDQQEIDELCCRLIHLLRSTFGFRVKGHVESSRSLVTAEVESDRPG